MGPCMDARRTTLDRGSLITSSNLRNVISSIVGRQEFLRVLNDVGTDEEVSRTLIVCL